MAEKQKGGTGMKGSRMLRSLASLRLTEALLFLIAFLCVVATVIPQMPYRPTEGLPPAERLIMVLSLRDVFHSLWFMAASAVLALNLLACMWVRMRWRGADRGMAMPATALCEVRMPEGSDPVRVAEGLRRLLSARHAIIDHEGGPSPVVVMGERGRLRRFAPLLVHASIFLILLASALAFTGFKGTMEIPEGTDLDVVTLYDGTHRRLPFSIRCDRFGIEYYESGMPSEYRSELSFLDKGTMLVQSPVLVNHPVSYRGILFSQSGYNQHFEATLTVKGPDGAQRISAGQGAVFEIDGAEHSVHVLRVMEDMMSMGPGVQLLIEGPRERHMLWLFGDISRISQQYPGITDKVPQFNPSLVKPFTFSLDGVSRRTTTILGVNRDPGMPFAAAGALLFTIGVIMIFLMVHERVWATIDDGQGGITVRLAMKRNGKTVPVDVHVCNQVKGLGSSHS